RGVHADGGVGGAGPARHEADARPAGELAVGLGHVAGAALVAAGDEADGVAGVVEGVERGEETLAGHLEDQVHAVDAKLVDEDPAARTGPDAGRAGAFVMGRVLHAPFISGHAGEGYGGGVGSGGPPRAASRAASASARLRSASPGR